MKKWLLVVFMVLLLTLSGCGKAENPIVTMEFQDYGEIEIELYPDKAPNTVANFVNLVEDGFYDNNYIHRVVPGFVIQGGDPDGNGTGGPGYTILGEFSDNNYKNNNLSHTRGVISMARQPDDMNSAGSQFFIVLSDDNTASLDGQYAGFGRVISGMNTIDKMVRDARIADEQSGLLAENYIITKATVNTFGEKYQVKKF